MTLPIVQVETQTTSKVSDELGMTTCTVTFSPDQDIVEWEVRVGGTGPGTGMLIHSGGAVNANADVQFDVEYDELTGGDTTYRINVYAKNSSNEWSAYG